MFRQQVIIACRLLSLSGHLAVLFAGTITACRSSSVCCPQHINQWRHIILTISWLWHFPNYSFTLFFCYSVSLHSHISDIVTCTVKSGCTILLKKDSAYLQMWVLECSINMLCTVGVSR